MQFLNMGSIPCWVQFHDYPINLYNIKSFSSYSQNQINNSLELLDCKLKYYYAQKILVRTNL